MKNIVIVLVIAALVLGLAATKPVASLHVKNRSADPIAVYFFEVADSVVGLNPVRFVALDPKTNKLFELAPGAYEVEVHACGEVETYTAKIAGRFNLTVRPAPGGTRRLAHPE